MTKPAIDKRHEHLTGMKFLRTGLLTPEGNAATLEWKKVNPTRGKEERLQDRQNIPFGKGRYVAVSMWVPDREISKKKKKIMKPIRESRGGKRS